MGQVGQVVPDLHDRLADLEYLDDLKSHEARGSLRHIHKNVPTIMEHSLL